MSAKDVRFGDDARSRMLEGVGILAVPQRYGRRRNRVPSSFTDSGRTGIVSGNNFEPPSDPALRRRGGERAICGPAYRPKS